MEPITGHLLPETCGCFDAPGYHGCETSPGDTIDTTDGPRVIGNTIRLHPVDTVPYCCKVADVDGYGWTEDPDGTCHATYRPWGPGEGSWQWKGTVMAMVYTCQCGALCRIDERDFVYAAMCPVCSQVYECEASTALTPTSTPCATDTASRTPSDGPLTGR